MTAEKDDDSIINKIFVKSIIVGATGVVLAAVYLIDGSPNDSNVGFWLYTPTSIFFLWPYQVLLIFKLRSYKLPSTSYIGAILTTLSMLMTIGIW